MLDNGQWTMDKNALAMALIKLKTERLRIDPYPDIGSTLPRYWLDIKSKVESRKSKVES